MPWLCWASWTPRERPKTKGRSSAIIVCCALSFKSIPLRPRIMRRDQIGGYLLFYHSIVWTIMCIFDWLLLPPSNPSMHHYIWSCSAPTHDWILLNRKHPKTLFSWCIVWLFISVSLPCPSFPGGCWNKGALLAHAQNVSLMQKASLTHEYLLLLRSHGVLGEYCGIFACGCSLNGWQYRTDSIMWEC